MERDASHRTFTRVARMRLNIDFAPTRRRASARSLLLFVGALVALGAASWNTLTVFDETQRKNHDVTMATLSRIPPQPALSAAQTDAINRAIRQLNLPWERLFAEVEARLDGRTVLLALEPDATNRVLRLHAEAKSAGDMLDFIRALETSTFLDEAILVRHEINEADRNRPLRFVAEARWPAD